VRLNLFLARAGKGSRREADRLIQAGRVLVNGQPPPGMGELVDPARDRVTLDGVAVSLPKHHRYLAYFKPRGLLVTRRSQGGRPNIFDSLGTAAAGLQAVGRLDLDSEGLLLLTDDGSLAEALLHPSTGIIRRYEVRVRPVPDARAMRALRSGADVEGVRVRPRRVELQGSERGEGILSFEIGEGRKREIRVLAREVGLEVQRLLRVAFGPVRLGTLRPGATRPLKPAEVAALRESAAGFRRRGAP
jgi:pseudouridine synthase